MNNLFEVIDYISVTLQERQLFLHIKEAAASPRNLIQFSIFKTLVPILVYCSGDAAV